MHTTHTHTHTLTYTHRGKHNTHSNNSPITIERRRNLLGSASDTCLTRGREGTEQLKIRLSHGKVARRDRRQIVVYQVRSTEHYRRGCGTSRVSRAWSWSWSWSVWSVLVQVLQQPSHTLLTSQVVKLLPLPCAMRRPCRT